MELYASDDFGKSWVFAGVVDQFHKDSIEQALFKAGYATRVLYLLDRDYFEFRAKAIFPGKTSDLLTADKPKAIDDMGNCQINPAEKPARLLLSQLNALSTQLDRN